MYRKHTFWIKSGKALGFLLLSLMANTFLVSRANAQTAYIDDAWWTYVQNGNGCSAGTLPGDMARLNWSPDVTNCNNTLTVFEIIYDRPHGTSAYTSIYTNAAHTIVACRAINQQYVDIPMAGECNARDYKIEVYRSGHTTPDYVRS